MERVSEIYDKVASRLPLPPRMLVTLVLLPGLRYSGVALADYINVIFPLWLIIQIGVICTLIFLRSVVLKSNHQGDVTVVTPGSAMSQTLDQMDVYTVVEYDLMKLQSMLGQLGLTASIAMGVFMYSGIPQVFLLQTLFAPQQLWSNPIFQIYMLEKRSIKGGPLSRPFKDQVPDFMANFQAKMNEGERRLAGKKSKKDKRK